MKKILFKILMRLAYKFIMKKITRKKITRKFMR